MTRERYYQILREKWEKVDKTDRDAIHEYNEFKRRLFKMYFSEK